MKADLWVNFIDGVIKVLLLIYFEKKNLDRNNLFFICIYLPLNKKIFSLLDAILNFIEVLFFLVTLKKKFK